MKRVGLISAGVVSLHTLVVNVALIVKYEYWGAPVAFWAGSVQRFVDQPVIRFSQFVMNRPELPVWMPSAKASDAALIREILVFDLFGGFLYGAASFIFLAIYLHRRRNAQASTLEL
jgi:hypothetical protein